MNVSELVEYMRVVIAEITPPPLSNPNSRKLEETLEQLHAQQMFPGQQIDAANITNNSLAIPRLGFEAIIPIVRSHLDVFPVPSPLPVIVNITSRDTSPDPQSKSSIDSQLKRAMSYRVSDVLIVSGDRYKDYRGTNYYDFKPSELVEMARAFRDRENYDLGILFGVRGNYSKEELPRHLEVLNRIQDAGANGLMTMVIANGEDAKRYIDSIRSKGIQLYIIGQVMFIDGKRMRMLDERKLGGTVPDWYRHILLTAEQKDVKKAILDFAEARAWYLIRSGYDGLAFNIINPEDAAHFREISSRLPPKVFPRQ